MWICKDCGNEVVYIRRVTEVSNISKSGKVFHDETKIQKKTENVFTCIKNPMHSSKSISEISEWKD